MSLALLLVPTSVAIGAGCGSSNGASADASAEDASRARASAPDARDRGASTSSTRRTEDAGGGSSGAGSSTGGSSSTTSSGGSHSGTGASGSTKDAGGGSSSSGSGTSGASSAYTAPPTSNGSSPNQWYWEIDPAQAGLGGLPAISAAYPASGSANIWDTDLFQDSDVVGGVPTGASPVVQAIHAAGHYSICYVECGAQQTGFPDAASFASADYTNGSNAATTQMQGYANEHWFNIRGFVSWSASAPTSFPSDGLSTSTADAAAAADIAAGLTRRFAWCKLEGHDAVEPDDLDGYTNASQTGAAGGGWGLTQADAAGFERWIAYQTHADGLAVFQKNDTANAKANEPLYDGVITEECNYYDDPCSGPGGDWDAYLSAGKPVLNAEYTSDGETTAKFCQADDAAGITGALFDVGLDGQTYEPCEP
jgi:hypothetical protein